MVQPADAPPVGSQITKDYQYEYRGLLIGSCTPYVTTELDGLLDQPAIVQYHSKAVAKHGVYYGYEVFDARVLQLTVKTDSDSVGQDYPLDIGVTLGEIAEGLVDDFANAFTIPAPFANQLTTPLTSSQIDDPLIIKRPGKDARQLFCHTTKRSVKVNYELATGLGTINLELYAGDPVVYSFAQHSGTLAIPGSGTTSSTANLKNLGNFPSTKLVVTLQGPGGAGAGSQLWTIANLTTGNTLRLDMTLVGTDIVTIDFNTKTITLNGGISYSFRRPDGVWWGLVPGDNLLQVTRQTADSVGSNITATYYDGFNSA